jgi:hypothetical protein
MTTKKAAAAVKKSPTRKTSVLAKPGIRSKPMIKALKKTKKEHKVKVVRDSFTMPQNEYQKIAGIKTACLKANMHVKKSEVLRAGLKLLAELSVAQLKLALSGLEKIKTGRPKKH